MLLYFTYFSSNSFIYEFYCVLLYILYCFSFSFTYTVYMSICMSPVYVYGPSCLILNKMMMMMMMIDNI